MLVVIHICQKDVDAALRNLAWARELGGKVQHDCLLTFEQGFNASAVMASASEYFRSVSAFAYPVMSRHPTPWPAFQNWAWRQTALRIRKLPTTQPWLWWEQDAVILVPGAFDLMASEYAKAGKPFMGADGATPTPEHEKHLNGVAIYPHDVTQYCPESMIFGRLPFDVLGGWRVYNQAHISPLFQHVWSWEGNQSPNACTFPDPSFLRRLNKEAVIFHRCKDGSLIEQLRSGRFHWKSPDVPPPIRRPKGRRMGRIDELPPRKTWKSKVTKFLGPLISPKSVSDVTVVITAFKRPEMLLTAYQSCKAAKVQHIVISASGLDHGVADVLKRIRKEDSNVILSTRMDDAGCNECWLRGAEQVRTSKMTILHDDDYLLPEYERVVAGKIQADFIHWDGNKHGPQGKINGCYVTRPDLTEGVYPASYLYSHLLKPDCYTLSPVSGCFPTRHVIETLEECQKNFGEWAHVRPQMMIGNDLMLWLRACQKLGTVHYSHVPLNSYGHWEGSTTYDDVSKGKMKLLPIYKAVRSYFLASIPKLIHAVQRYQPKDPDTIKRVANAESSWRAGYMTGLVLENHQWKWPRDSTSIGEPKQVPFLRDVLKQALEAASSDKDLIVLTNDDTIVNQFFWFKCLDWTKRLGAGCSFRRNVTFETSPDPTKFPNAGKLHCGRDAFLFTQDWLKEHLQEIPDYVMTFCDWDSTLAMLIRLTQGEKPTADQFLIERPSGEIPNGFIHHVNHEAPWAGNFNQIGNRHSRALTDEFFAKRLGWPMPKLRGSW